MIYSFQILKMEVLEPLQTFFPKELAIEIVFYYIDSFHDSLIFTIEWKGFVPLPVPQAAERKKLHEWAQERHYHHFGYLDRSEKAEITKSYKCNSCENWRCFHSLQLWIDYCCRNYDEGVCGDDMWYGVNLAATMANIHISKAMEPGTHVPIREWTRHNAMIIMKEMKRDVCKKLGLTSRALRRALQRRDA